MMNAPLLSGRDSVVVLANKVVVSEAAVELGVVLMEVDLGDNSVAVLADQRTIFCKSESP